jgi:tRNA pseudouridine32 synthase/23S rRNA pseudouridine746 synthase
MHNLVYEHTAFCTFDESTTANALATGLTFSIDADAPHPLCRLAASQLQSHLEYQQEWKHNFGLSAEAEGAIIGKMFGVLAVRTKENELGYLSAFSGKLAGANHHAGFVPPIFDTLAEGGFVNSGMTQLTQMVDKINALAAADPEANAAQIHLLKTQRKNHSISLQNKIFEQYHFLNKTGASKSLVEIFENTVYKKPPAGAGECAAPKLLQYAFRHEMEPLALAEFWWGLSPKSVTWQHGHFYAPCREKCAPILAHMLA